MSSWARRGKAAGASCAMFMLMLSPYKVLDLTDQWEMFCGYILAHLGAQVLAVEPPGGSAVRAMQPLAGDDDRAPVRTSVPQSFLHAGADAASAALIALQARPRDGARPAGGRFRPAIRRPGRARHGSGGAEQRGLRRPALRRRIARNLPPPVYLALPGRLRDHHADVRPCLRGAEPETVALAPRTRRLQYRGCGDGLGRRSAGDRRGRTRIGWPSRWSKLAGQIRQRPVS